MCVRALVLARVHLSSSVIENFSLTDILLLRIDQFDKIHYDEFSRVFTF